MIEKLLEYQRVDSTLRDVENEIAKSEERKITHSAAAFLKNVNDNIAALDKRAEELASTFYAANKSYEKLAEELKGYEDLDVGEDLEQLNYIRKKAQALSSEINSLAEAIESVSKEMEAVLKDFNKLGAETKKKQEIYKEYKPKYDALKKSKQEEIASITAKLDELKNGIPDDILASYEQCRKDKIFPVLNEATVIGNGVYCKCGKSLPDAAFKSLKSGLIVECESCRRLLYIAQK